MVDFLTKTVFGIVVLAVGSSLIGAFLSFCFSCLWRKVLKRYKRNRFIKMLVKSGKYFGQGSRAAYAKSQTSFHQVLLVGDYIIDILLSLGKTLLFGMVALCLLVILKDYWISFPIIIVVASFLISIELRKIRECKVLYHQTFELIYGEEYFKTEMEGIKEYWGEIANNKHIK